MQHPDIGVAGRPSVRWLTRLVGALHRTSAWDGDGPMDEALFSVERLEEHARSLAASQAVTTHPGRGSTLTRRLEDNGVVLLDAYLLAALLVLAALKA